jgi:hypothetical protein
VVVRAAELRAALEDQRVAVWELADGRLEITGADVEQVATLATPAGLRDALGAPICSPRSWARRLASLTEPRTSLGSSKLYSY